MASEAEREFMRHAVRLSAERMREGAGGPFGAVIVKDGKVIAEGWNEVTSANDPTAHAEVVAIRLACEKLGTFSLEGCDIYASCEPCPMCLAAIYWARIDRIFFANTRDEAAAIGFDDAFLYREIPKAIEERSIPTKHLAIPEAKAVFDEWEKKPDKVGTDMRRGAGLSGIRAQPGTLGLDARNLPLEGRSKPASVGFGRGGISPLAARGRQNGVTNRVEVAHDFVRPEPHDRVALRLQPFCPSRVGLLIEGVLLSVDFHDELRHRAEEIDDVATDRVLTAKSEPIQSAVSQLAPQLELGIGHVAAHASGQRPQARRHGSARQSPLPKSGSRCSPTFDLPSRGRLTSVGGFEWPPIPNPQSPIPQ